MHQQYPYVYSIMKLQHLILTRFNLQYEPDCHIGIQPEWLEDRCRLFETYCLPSLQRQTCQNYTWIIYVDSATPEPYLSRIKGYSSLLPQLKVILSPYREDINTLYHETGIHYAQGYDYLLTSRIDNDDRFSEDYVERVQQIAQEGFEGVISFPNGRQNFVNDNKSYKITYIPNHYLSRVERSGFYTVLGFDHRDAKKYALKVVKTDHPMWEEIVHGNNIANQYTPAFRHKIESFSDFTDLSHRYLSLWMRRVQKMCRIITGKQKQ